MLALPYMNNQKKKPQDKWSVAFYVRFTPAEAKVLRQVSKQYKYPSVASFIKTATIEAAAPLA